MRRVKTNIVELKKLKKQPCYEWLQRFDEKGKIDAHRAFELYGEKYEWLYKNSNYDLISWEIENDCFDWQKHSWAVAQFCKKKLDINKYNWKEHYWAIAMYCPELLKNKENPRYKIKKSEVDFKLKEAIELLRKAINNEITDDKEHEYIFYKPLKFRVIDKLYGNIEKYMFVRSISIWPLDKMMFLYKTEYDFVAIFENKAIEILETKTIIYE
jgi:hypothetical protein